MSIDGALQYKTDNQLTPQPHSPILNCGDATSKRQEILTYFQKTYAIYESLFKVVTDKKAFYEQADPLRHPIIFYLAHTAVFYINKLYLAKRLKSRVNPSFESMFAIGVDEMSWDDINSQNYAWPDVDAVWQYREQVRDIVMTQIESIDFTMPIHWESPMWVILMGIEHERIHLETSSVLIRQLPLAAVTTSPLWPRCQMSADAPDNRLLSVKGAEVRLGKNKNSPIYGWDNEYGTFKTTVEDFKASQYLVSNKEFFRFVKAGGYHNKRYWTDEGYAWLKGTNTTLPKFWLADPNGQYRLRLMTEEIDMPWDWPVEVNYLEAKAFCQFLSEETACDIRLPTEAEWYLLADDVCADDVEWSSTPGNINLTHYASPCPVNTFSRNQFFDLIGNVWQWTETPIFAFQQFKTHPLYDDFSVPTFDNQHNLMKGGSWISTGNEATRAARYAFRRHFFQHAGFRYVAAKKNIAHHQNVYETDALVSQYIEFHYGADYFDVTNFATQCVERIIETLPHCSRMKALDIGCAVGRASFELSRAFKQVDGLDFSARFIRIASELQQHGRIQYQLQTEGDLCEFRQVELSTLQFSNTANIHFMQADACNLAKRFCGYDLIFASNLIDRLSEPALFLQSIDQRLTSRGFLVLTSPYTWLEDFTAKEHWLGGYRGSDGEIVDGLSGLTRILSNFDMVAEPVDIPFVIRETRRKFQHTVSQMTFWQKKT